MYGFIGIDFVFVVDGIFGGVISFGGYVWDYVVGVVLV